MRILHIITSLKRSAGTSVFCAEVCDQLVARGHEVAIAVLDPSDQDRCPTRCSVPVVSVAELLGLEEPDGRNNVSDFIVCVPSGDGLGLRPLAFYDLVHIHGIWHPVLHRAANCAVRSGIPIMWSPHGMLAPWAMRHKWWKKFLSWHIYQKRDLMKATLFHVTARLEAEWIVELGFKQPCCVIPLGTHLHDKMADVGRRGSVETGEALAVDSARLKVALFVGRVYSVKNLDSLIRAWKSMGVSGWTLVIAGPDQDGHQKTLKALAESLGLAVVDLSIMSYSDEQRITTVRNGSVNADGRMRDVVFTGPVYGEVKDIVYRLADLFVLPSHTENFGGVVVDAMAFGIPVVVSDRTPWTDVETVGCGKICGTDVASIAKILREMITLTDQCRHEMGDKGRQWAKLKYTWHAVTESLEAAYRSMLSGNSESGHEAKSVRGIHKEDVR